MPALAPMRRALGPHTCVRLHPHDIVVPLVHRVTATACARGGNHTGVHASSLTAIQRYPDAALPPPCTCNLTVTHAPTRTASSLTCTSTHAYLTNGTHPTLLLLPLVQRTAITTDSTTRTTSSSFLAATVPAVGPATLHCPLLVRPPDNRPCPRPQRPLSRRKPPYLLHLTPHALRILGLKGARRQARR